MIEIRNDEILSEQGVKTWADRLARALEMARQARQ
jgi:predicted N-formylglutamate amidohydrolase